MNCTIYSHANSTRFLLLALIIICGIYGACVQGVESQKQLGEPSLTKMQTNFVAGVVASCNSLITKGHPTDFYQRINGGSIVVPSGDESVYLIYDESKKVLALLKVGKGNALSFCFFPDTFDLKNNKTWLRLE